MYISKKRIAGSAIAAISFVFGLLGPFSVYAATTPTLGAAATYGVLGSTYTNTVAGTTINGDVGFTTGPAVAPAGVHPNYGSGAPYPAAGIAQGAALSNLNGQPCSFNFPAGAVNLATDITHGPIGVYTPGVYCATGAMTVAGPVTLSGSGTFIFRTTSALNSTAGAIVTLAGADACDVFWTPVSATTLAANTTFVGTVISDAGVTVGAATTWLGRSFAFGGTVTTDTNTITVPSCVPPPPASSNIPATVNVVKLVINDNGGTKTVADFPLYVDGTLVVSGTTNTFPAIPGVYTVTETGSAGYAQSFTGDCDANGQFNLTSGQNKFCIITNNDIGAPVVVPPVPPLIDVVKVPSPLSLPDGPGLVNYTYTLRNIGTVSVGDITMVGDSCSPIVRISGDANGDNRLDLNEAWVHTCATTLTETHTNTVVATGWANGISATDIASATVVVGQPIIAPLIHVTKVPNPLALLAGGGLVTYTERITNPGTVPLSNVGLNDDKCAVSFVSGDANGDSRLDPSETWTYTCQSRLAVTTTNTATAVGEANGLTVRDFAIATVVVATAVPLLPRTGTMPLNGSYGWAVMAAGIIALSLVLVVKAMRKKAAS